MYNPATRVLAVLELLQSHDHLDGAELARRLEVDRRSVRRYIVMLQDMGIPVEGLRGIDGGYRLRPGFKLPPLMLTGDEAVAVTLGLLSAQRLGAGISPAAIDGALAKIGRVLPRAVSERVGALRDALALEPVAALSPPDGGLLVELGVAAAQERSVRLQYRADSGNETDRVIDPYGVAFRERYWYVAGHCHLRRAVRLFRIDRIVRAESTDLTFHRPQDFDCLAFVTRSIATQPGRWHVEVLLDLSPEEARRRVPPGYGLLEPEEQGVLFRTEYDDLDALSRVLVRLDCRFSVREPDELRGALRRLAGRLTAAAAESSPKRQ